MEVCSVVQSIIAAFNNGLDVFKRMGDQQKSKKRNKDPPNQGELQLRESLHRRPQEIQSTYDRSVAKLGHRFEIGDTIAHTSLAHTLLVLNTGLINIINSALSDDPKKKSRPQPIPHRSLLSISEIAAADAIQALSQLDHRLSSAQLAITAGPTLKQSRPNRTQESIEKTMKPRRKIIEGSNNPFKPAKRPPPSPLLARGGWVRPKCNSSAASNASSSKLNVVRPTTQRRTKSSPLISSQTQDSKTQPIASSAQRSQAPPQSMDNGQDDPLGKKCTHHHRRRTTSNPHPQREPSMLLVSSDFFSSQPVTHTDNHHQHQYQQHRPPTAPPIPPKIPLYSRPNTSSNDRPTVSSPRYRPSSVATFMTASTKIGEIPEHLWPDTTAIQDRPLPYVVPPPLVAGFGEERKKARGRGFKFWKKSEQIDENVGAGPIGSGKEVVVY